MTAVDAPRTHPEGLLVRFREHERDGLSFWQSCRLLADEFEGWEPAEVAKMLRLELHLELMLAPRGRA